MELSLALIPQVAQGLSLAACAGMRAFLPVLVVGIAGRLDWIPLTSYFDWMASTPALTIFSVAVVAELLGDKFPVVDNLLDGLQVFVKPVAGTVLMASSLTELPPEVTAVLAIVMGGSVAGMVHLGKSKTRLVSTVATAGSANPFVSIAEDGVSLAGSIMAIVWPILMFVALLFAGSGFIYLWRYRRARPGDTVQP